MHIRGLHLLRLIHRTQMNNTEFVRTKGHLRPETGWGGGSGVSTLAIQASVTKGAILPYPRRIFRRAAEAGHYTTLTVT
jgi:hypothetical protein